MFFGAVRTTHLLTLGRKICNKTNGWEQGVQVKITNDNLDNLRYEIKSFHFIFAKFTDELIDKILTMLTK